MCVCVVCVCVYACVHACMCLSVCLPVCISVSVTQVHIDETNKHYGVTRLGVVRASPDAITLPSSSKTLHPDVLCVLSGGVSIFGLPVRLW